MDSEHRFVPVKGLTGCVRCGYARGHHPTAATLRREGYRFDAAGNPIAQHDIVPVGGWSARQWCRVHETYADLEATR